MKRGKYVVFVIIFLTILLFIPQPGMAKEYEISNYNFEINLTDKGDYIITEEITYNFLEGSFSSAYRDINKGESRGLKFISLKGKNKVITEREVKEKSSGLAINWKYPSSNDQATFILKYKVIGGLQATKNKNILAFNVIEEGWDVPIKDIDVNILFPQNIEQKNFSPLSDVKINNSSLVKFHKNKIDPNSNYSIVVKFAKIMDVKGPQKINYSLYLIYGLVLGLIIALMDIINTYRNKPNPVKTGLNPTDLGFVNLANIYYPTSSQNRKGISAAVFSLAQRRKIKLISKLTKKIFGQKDAEVMVDILSEEGLTETEKKLIVKLKEKENLEEFMKDNKTVSKIAGMAREKLIQKGLLSSKKLKLRKKYIFLGVLLIVLSIISLIVGLLSNLALVFSLSVFLMVYGIGSLIKLSFLPVLSPEGMALKEKIEDLLDQKKNNFEKILEEDNKRALNLFFRELPFLVLHPEFNNHQLNKYKKELKDVEDFKKPYWIDFNLSELDKTLDALEAVEVIDYVLMSTIMVAAYTSAGTAGSSGSGGAGGGGAA